MIVKISGTRDGQDSTVTLPGRIRMNEVFILMGGWLLFTEYACAAHFPVPLH